MLALTDGRLGRRAFLGVGGLALGGWTLEHLLRTRAALAEAGAPTRNRSVIFLFLHGGPPQTETFDPKMDAPSGVRSVTGEVPTTLPGVTFGATFEQLARRAHKFSVVRSFVTGDGNHDIKPVVSAGTFGANLGSVWSRIAGPTHPITGVPRNVALFPRAVEPSSQPAVRQFGDFTATGPFGRGFAPFVPGGGGDFEADLQLNVPRERLADRRTILEKLDRLRSLVDASEVFEGVDKYRAQAFDTILGSAAQAFDLSREDPKVVERYDTEPLLARGTISKQWNNHRNYYDNIRTLGRLLLLARRLCEAGAGFVTVTTNFVWDFHSDVNNATVEEGLRYTGVPLDHALSAFLDDIEARGLSDRILLVACGEMGRTPRLNARGGRDHWGKLAPLLLAGSGVQPGRVVGQSTADVGEPATPPVTIADLHATVLHTLFDVGQLRVTRGVPQEVIRAATAGTPIDALS